MSPRAFLIIAAVFLILWSIYGWLVWQAVTA